MQLPGLPGRRHIMLTHEQTENCESHANDAPCGTDAPDTLKNACCAPSVQADDLQRGKRMMNLVQGTLNRFKDEASETAGTEASLRRTLLEQRLFEKLQQEKAALAEAVAREQHARTQQLDEAFHARLLADLERMQREREALTTAFAQTTTEPRLFWAPANK